MAEEGADPRGRSIESEEAVVAEVEGHLQRSEMKQWFVLQLDPWGDLAYAQVS